LPPENHGKGEATTIADNGSAHGSQYLARAVLFAKLKLNPPAANDRVPTVQVSKNDWSQCNQRLGSAPFPRCPLDAM